MTQIPDLTKRAPNTQYILSLSYGKDSLACLGAIEKLGWPLDRIVHAEIWATDDIPADLPPMVEFKKKADAIIKERFGIEVEHVCAMTTYEEVFYRQRVDGKYEGKIRGFPTTMSPWCNSRLKVKTLTSISKNHKMEIGGGTPKKLTFEDLFYRVRQRGNRTNQIVGWPMILRAWCQSDLKMSALKKHLITIKWNPGGGGHIFRY